MNNYSLESKEQVIKQLNSSYQGLSSEEANKRLQEYGLNELKNKNNNLIIKLILNQLSNFLVIILIIAALISYVLGDTKDFILIIIIVVLNLILGFFQEYKSEKAIESLKKMSSLKSRVLRNNHIIEIETKYIVPGDIILFEEGSKIPADARIIEHNQLETQEASLTGESTPVEKNNSIIENIANLGDQKNMVFSSTIVTRGTGRAIVTNTGMNTEIGKIARLIETEHKNQTPLQIKINSLSKKMGLIALIICFAIMIAIFYTTQDLFEALIVGLSLAVSAIPEGMPALITICLAIGVQRMSKKNAIIRKLPAVETLGSTNIIVSDKTGTLTKNEMTVKKIYLYDSIIEVEGSGYNSKGNIIYDKISVNDHDIDMLLSIGVICNNSDFDDVKSSISGDPTEASLLVSASKFHILKKELDTVYKRIKEIPFDSKNKYMATINEKDNKKMLFIKGAPDILLKLSSHILKNGKKIPLTDSIKQKILAKNHEFSNESLRVLAFGYKDSNVDSMKNITFVGLQAMIDPPRESIKEDIQKCNIAGINVKMVTGDYVGTAIAIGNQIGIAGKAITGEELEQLTDDDLAKIVRKYDIYARVNPEHKLRIVKALQKLGYTVAVTGDGVNDAPALKKSDIGIAMGITGTDVSKESSDMILSDDHFHSIVNAVEEGRVVYSNIQKFITYMLSVNIAEIIIILFAIFLGWPLPLLATQILMINLVTDGLPALALSVDPPSKDIMLKKPKRKNSSIITKELLVYIFLINFMISMATLYLFNYSVKNYGLEEARTIAFTMIVISELLAVYLIRSLFYVSMFKHNKYLNLAVLASLLVHIFAIYGPFNEFFHVVPISLSKWLVLFVVSLVIMVIFYLLKKSLDNYKSKNNLEYNNINII